MSWCMINVMGAHTGLLSIECTLNVEKDARFNLYHELIALSFLVF